MMRKPLLILAICAGSAASASSAAARPSGLGAATSSAAAVSAAARGHAAATDATAEEVVGAPESAGSNGNAVTAPDIRSGTADQPEPARETAAGGASLPRGTVSVTSDPSPPGSGRPFYVRGSSQFRMLAISDEDPANGRVLLWSLEGGYKLAPTASVFIRGGLLQRFVVPSDSTELIPQGLPLPTQRERDSIDTSPFLLRDVVVGGRYRHSIDLGSALGGRTLDMAYTLNLYLPASLASQRRDLTMAPEVVSRARINVVKGLSTGVDLSGQYRFHRTAERFGEGAGQNVQTMLGASVVADYIVADLADFGQISTGADVRWSWEKTYGSRDDHASTTSSRDFWRQDYGWDVYASYSPRSWLSLSASLEQSAPVLRDGIVNVRIPNRDETELVFTLSGSF